MLALACRRAGLRRSEGVTLLASGVKYDNMGAKLKANVCYERVLQLKYDTFASGQGDTTTDPQLRSLAHNHLGANLQEMGQWAAAAEQHRSQCQLGERSGLFVAHLNLGLALAKLKDFEGSIQSYREALQLAIAVNSLLGESIACGNLAIVGREAGDLETSKACLVRYLQLNETLGNPIAAADAHERLGTLASELGDLQEAGARFESALTIASTQPVAVQSTVNVTKVELGMVQGSLRFDEWMHSALFFEPTN